MFLSMDEISRCCAASWRGLMTGCLLFLGGTVTPAMAADSCDMVGMYYEFDRGRTSVFSDANTRGRVLGHLPASRGHPGSWGGIKLRVLTAASGWLFVKVESDLNERPDLRFRRPKLGRFWIRPGQLWLNVISNRGFSEPSPTTRIVLDFEKEIDSNFQTKSMTLLECSGKWGKIQYRFVNKKSMQAKIVTGWFRGICESMTSTCDGIISD